MIPVMNGARAVDSANAPWPHDEHIYVARAAGEAHDGWAPAGAGQGGPHPHSVFHGREVRKASARTREVTERTKAQSRFGCRVAFELGGQQREENNSISDPARHMRYEPDSLPRSLAYRLPGPQDPARQCAGTGASFNGRRAQWERSGPLPDLQPDARPPIQHEPLDCR
jgi:hypothetical protein